MDTFFFPQLFFDIWYAMKFFVVLLLVLVCVRVSVCVADMLASLLVVF